MSDTLLLNASGMPLSYLPLSAITWQRALYHYYLDKVEIIKSYDEWTLHSQRMDLKVPSIVIMKKQVKFAKELKYSRANVFLRDDFTCQLQITGLCADRKGKTKPTELTIDHVTPRSHEGRTLWTNVVSACKDCNAAKGADHTILPLKKPKKPDYYEILAKRKGFPLIVRDADWAHYIDWPADLIRVMPQPGPDGK